MSNADRNTDWVARDLAHVWHPCTQMRDHEQLPLIPIRRGQGVWLEDFSGRRYLDAVSSWWTNLFGHCHPQLMAALRQQLDELDHVLLAGFTHAPVIELSEQLCQLAPPGLNKCFYADNGSSAVEVALKMSFHYWKNLGQSRTHFITLGNSYHGETLGALAVGDVPLYKSTYAPLLLQTHVATSPDCYDCPPDMSWETYSRTRFAEMEALLERHAATTCAVIVEPLVQCAGGMRMYHPVYLSLLREACSRHNVHLIADEIAVGFGRTGTLFACEQANITPDFLCLSKGLTGGTLPLSVTLTTQTVYDAFYADYATQKAFLHSHSYTGNPLACSAALATLALFRQPLGQQSVLARVNQIGQRMESMAAALREHPHVSEVRRTGAILAIEMVQDRRSRNPYPWQERRGLRVYEAALAQDVLLRPLGNVIYCMPPYVIDDGEIDHMLRVATQAIDHATGG